MRKLVYIGLLICFGVVVVLKAGVVQEKRDAETITVFAEWERNGKPVEVETIKKRTLEQVFTLSGKLGKNGLVSAEVSPSWLRRIKRAKQCREFEAKGEEACVQWISKTLDPMTGMVSPGSIWVPHRMPSAMSKINSNSKAGSTPSHSGLGRPILPSASGTGVT